MASQYLHYILAGFTAALSAANIACVYYIFGKSSDTAVFMTCLHVYGCINVLMLTFVEQFSYYYSRILLNSLDDADRFFSNVVISTLLLGAGIACGLIVISSLSGFAFVPGLNGSDLILAKKIIRALAVNVFASTALYVIQQRFNCRKKIGVSYALTLAPLVFQLCGIVSSKKYNWKLDTVAAIISFGGLATLSSVLLFLRQELRFPRRVDLKMVLSMCKESARVRTAHNIHNFLSMYIIGAAASAAPAVHTSIFFAVKRFVDGFTQLASGPFIRSFPVLVIQKISTSEFESIIETIKRNTRFVVIFKVLIMILTVLAIKVLEVNWGLTNSETVYLWTTILFLFLFGLQIAIETPYSMVCAAYGRYDVFYYSNACFIVTLAVISYLSVILRLHELLPIGMAVSQVVVFIRNRSYANQMLSIKSGLPG